MTDETLWAIRTLFEHLARSRPLILVFHGFQWAEATFDPLPFDVEAARRYGQVYALVRAAGRWARTTSRRLGSG